MNEKQQNRRSVLKSAAIGISAAGSLPILGVQKGKASPQTDSERSGNDSEMSHEVVDEGDEYHIVAVTKDDETEYYRVDKNTGAVRAVSSGGISTMGHDELISRSDVQVRQFGSCGGHLYRNHYYVALSIELGETWDSITGGSLEAGICAVLDAKGGMASAAAGGIGCFVIGRLFLDHINPSGSTGTWGAWDCHRGYLNYENICHGVTSQYSAGRSQVPSLKRVPGVHFEAL